MAKAIDKKYIKDFRNGNTEIFEYIYEYYRNPIYFFAFSLVRNAADAEEILQETFIRVIRGIHNLKDNSSFHSWIYQITYSVSMNYHNKNKNIIQPGEDVNLEEMISAKQSPDSALKDSEIYRVVREEIEKLPEKLMKIAVLKYFEGFTVTEISRITNVPAGTVKTRLLTIRERIQPILDDKGYSPRKYLTVIFIPTIYQVFKDMQKSYPISESSANQIIQNLNENALANTSLATAATKTALTIKAMIASAVCMIGVGIFSLTPLNDTKIEAISHFQESTNQSIEVEIKLTKPIDEQLVSVTYEGDANKSIPFTIKENILSFVAKYNGTYTIMLPDEEEKLEINNIDKIPPEISNVVFSEGILDYQVVDAQNEVDEKRSYILLDGKQLPLEPCNLGKDFVGTIHIYIYDNLGNMANYQVDIGETLSIDYKLESEEE